MRRSAEDGYYKVQRLRHFLHGIVQQPCNAINLITGSQAKKAADLKA